jgi:hypothetical protein
MEEGILNNSLVAIGTIASIFLFNEICKLIISKLKFKV